MMICCAVLLIDALSARLGLALCYVLHAILALRLANQDAFR